MIEDYKKIDRCQCDGIPAIEIGEKFGCYVQCPGCKNKTGIYGSEQQAINSWNFLVNKIGVES